MNQAFYLEGTFSRHSIFTWSSRTRNPPVVSCVNDLPITVVILILHGSHLISIISDIHCLHVLIICHVPLLCRQRDGTTNNLESFWASMRSLILRISSLLSRSSPHLHLRHRNRAKIRVAGRQFTYRIMGWGPLFLAKNVHPTPIKPYR